MSDRAVDSQKNITTHTVDRSEKVSFGVESAGSKGKVEIERPATSELFEDKSVAQEVKPSKKAAPKKATPRKPRVNKKVSDQWQPVTMLDNVTFKGAMSKTSNKVFSKSVKGRFAKWRIALVLITQILYFGVAWFNWDGRQAVLFDLGTRKFYIFGLILWPQDVFYMALILIMSAYGLFFFTALAGRLFCGYACPQTVYTEVFMWIERFIEGDRPHQIRLQDAPWRSPKGKFNFEKLWKRTAKHSLWVVFSVWSSFTLVGYFSPIRTLLFDYANGLMSTWAWFWLIFYAIMMYMFAGVARESVCKHMCPYARFQSVMIDSDTFIVTYDRVRGEPRGPRSKKVDHVVEGWGDCVDCNICVQVCPTGIDIRDGMQYMCIGCGACIDACDEVMDRVGYQRGLIRYQSENGILLGLSFKQAAKRFLRPRTAVYATLLMILVVGFFTSFFTRNPIQLSVIRDRGAMYRETAEGMIQNVYQIQIINKTEQSHQFEVYVDPADIEESRVIIGNSGSNQVTVNPLNNERIPMVIEVDPELLPQGKLDDVTIKVRSLNDDGAYQEEHDTIFFTP
ncbi:MAG: cytochrome c oxidase accessory protein CcoG [Alcaligenaceae bacterium]|nr:cytochrome c oxidase accessory protein CcoG [Alcaligenaceae bacterium]